MHPLTHITPHAPADEPAGEAMGGTGGALGEPRQTLSGTARKTVAKIKDSAGDAAARAKEQAGHFVAGRKETAADRVGDYSTAIHESARSLEDKDPNIAWFTHRAADRLQGWADYVRQSDFDAIRGDVENFARRHPAAFFGGLFLAGLVLGNVVKASRDPLSDRDRQFADGNESEPAPGDLRPNAGSEEIPAPATHPLE